MTTANLQPQGVTRPNRSLTSNVFSAIKESENVMARQYKAKPYKSKMMRYSAVAEKQNLTTVILLSEDKWFVGKTAKIYIIQGKKPFYAACKCLMKWRFWNNCAPDHIALLVFWIKLASTWDMVKQSGLFVFAGCSCCQSQESCLLPTANQSQEKVWMSVNHIPQMGHNLSPLITVSKKRVTRCWPSPLNMLTVCHKLTHLSIAMQSVNRRKSPNLSSWNEARCQISERRRRSSDNKKKTIAHLRWCGCAAGPVEPQPASLSMNGRGCCVGRGSEQQEALETSFFFFLAEKTPHEGSINLPPDLTSVTCVSGKRFHPAIVEFFSCFF